MEILILKADKNLESWVTIITFLLQVHAEANQSRLPEFYPLRVCIQKRHNISGAFGVTMM